MPAEHLDVVEEICFDGTPAHSERRWANSAGYVTREFRVTMEVATTLIDRGIPFTLTTVDPGNAHLQAVIGYDSHRHSLIIRDPGERHFNEFQVEEMLKHYLASGPRGMAMVPQEKAELLDGIEFPEAKFYDLFFQVDIALEAHKREDAEKVVEQMKSLNDDHRLTLRARGNLANYDANINELLLIAEAMLKKYPDDVNTLVSKMACLHELGRREERVALLQAQIAKHDCDPMLWARYASELVNDAREHENATYYLRRGIRYRPHDTAAYDLLAGILLDQQRQDEAIQLYRFAACINDKNEVQAKSYFCAARVKGQTDQALQFLNDRFNRFGKQSSHSTRTLCWALEQLDRTSDAFKVLDRGYKMRSDDGDFMLYAADFCGRYGKLDQAEKLLKKAENKVHQTDWLRANALASTYRGERREPLQQWLKIIEAEPLDSNAHRCAAELLADTEGPEAAIAHLNTYVDRFPHSYALRMLLIEWLRGEESDEFQPQLREFIRLNPNDAWALRELAFAKLKDREFDQASALADDANAIDPTHPAVNFVRGRVERARANNDVAKQHFRNSLKLGVDYEFAVAGLMDCCETKVEREKELAFVYTELQNQVNFGDGLLSYRESAAQTLESKVLLEKLQEALDERPDLWHGWSAMIRQLSDMQRHEEAIEHAEKATDRFPLLPRMWMDRAMAHAACGDIDGEIQSLSQAKEINPNWGESARLLSEAYEKKGDLDKARAEIERVIISEPRDVRNHGFLASLMWDQGQKQEAIDCLTKVVKMQPGYEWAWNALRGWAAEMKQDEVVVDITRQLTETRPKDYRSWLLYAESLGEREQIDQAVQVLDKAIELNPMNPEGHNQKSYQLARAGKFDEAVAAAQPAVFAGKLPIELKSRAAWIEGERGNMETAVGLMEKVVQQDQDYFWAWHRLAEWYEFLENTSKYYKAANEMTRLAPQNPVSWGYLGDAELRRNNAKAAKKNFLQAVQLSPAYSFASSRLVDLQIADEEYDDALATIDLASPHIPPAWVLSEKLRIESLRGDQKAAFAILDELAVTPADDSGAIDNAVESLFMADWGAKVMPIIDRLLNEEQAQPGVAYVYMNLGATLGHWDTMQSRLPQLEDRPELWKEGIKKFLEEMATGGELPRMHKFIDQHRQQLHSETDLWEAVGDAYNSAELFQKTLDWMGQWQERPELTSNIAFTHILANWNLKRPDDAMETIRFALTNLPPDASTGLQLTLAAFYELVHGDLESCVDAVGMVDAGNLPGTYQLIYQHIVIILENLSTGGSYGEVAQQLKEVWAAVPPEVQKIPFLNRFHKLANWRAADLHGKKLKAMWLKMKI
ncbi:MAG: tetratricopeptide repeat protein [Rubripirellula sp.]